MTETYINHGELLTQSLRDVKANFPSYHGNITGVFCW